MYLDHYGLSAKPFDKTPNPAFFYRSPIHEEALARLQYGTEEREFTILTGEIGTGKTLLSRALIDSLDDQYLPILLINPRLTPNQFLKTVASRLGIGSPSFFRTNLLDQINEALFRLYEEGRCPVIIIDEAQLIPSKATFDEIRLLTNFQLDEANLLSLILIGQTELRRRLKHNSFDAIRQRVGIRYHLGPMGREDTGNYISHRLQVAGGDPGLVTPEAADVIFRYSGGLPRVINNIVSNALLMGFSKDLSQIGPDIILDVVEDLELEPV
ncbi:MAG: AAA family ATPase [bacterium]|nr:MAG: AAA family ATPase [bacterium]